MSWWHLHPDVIAWIALIEGLYLYGLRQVGRPQGLRATRGQMAWFTLGVAVLYAVAGTPLHDLGEQRLFTAHMVQHMLFTLVAPPMLLLGTPDWLLRPLWRNRTIFRIARFVTQPLFAFLLFNVLTLATHLPPVMNATLTHHWFHFCAHALLIMSATLMWWPVLSPSPELPRSSPLFQMIYLFLQSFVPSVLASFITFSSSVFYSFYATVPRIWGIDPVEDQRWAGLTMKLAGGLILWIVIGIVFFRWAAREERASRPGGLRWDEVEDELTRMGLTAGDSPPRRA